MLTPAIVKAAAPQARAYKLFDQGGLHLHVAPSGSRTWRLKFRWQGREQLLVLGRLPEMALPIARARRDAARELLGKGIDPRGCVDIEVNTVEALARDWHAHMASRWSAAHAGDVLAGFERDLFPAIGARDPESISAKELLGLLRRIEARGSRATARRMRQRLSAMFGYGVSLNLCSQDPAEQLGRALQGADLARPHAALVNLAECQALLCAADEFPRAGKSVRLASRFLALTAVRLDPVRRMRWSEVEDLDGPEPLWRVPAEHMKLARVKKGEEAFDHLVPLAPAAVAVLREAKAISTTANEAEKSDNGLVFPGRGANSSIGEGAIRQLYIDAGFGGRHVPHGWRASFSTILNEDMGDEWRATIDRALAHSGMGKVEAAYNRAQQLQRRRRVFERWAGLLTRPLSETT